jgi:predicted AAA+ superfamily ATPase
MVDFTKTNDFFPPHNEKLQEALKQAVIYGSMPDVVKLFPEANLQNKIIRYLENYKETYIEKDIRMLKQIGDLSAFSRLFDILYTQTANILVKNELCANVGISFATMQNYLGVLESTFIIDLLQPYSRNTKKRLVINQSSCPQKIHSGRKNCDYGVVVYNGEFKLDRVNKLVFFPVQYFA